MYCIKRGTYQYDPVDKQTTNYLEFLTYDGWVRFDSPPIDLKGVILFTEGERKANELPPNEEFLWYGAYKR